MTVINTLFTATCAGGLEQLVADEAAALGGYGVACAPGAVHFQGTLETAYRMCLWSRFASRVLMPVAAVPASDTDALYAAAAAVDWSEHLTADRTFAVDCTVHTAAHQHSHYAALRVKDAVVDQFRDRFNQRPAVNTQNPDVRIHAILEKDTAALCLDLSGESLHRRGYRTAGGEAPLKETLAAAIVHLSGWPGAASPECALMDPMCGSATLLIEAALMFGEIAPGLGRTSFGFLGWCGHDPPVWKRLVDEALGRREQALHRPWPHIIGFDASRTAVAQAIKNIEQAGLSGKVHVERRELAGLSNPLAGKRHGAGWVIVNPPYGERLGEIGVVKYLYRFLGRVLRRQCAGWQAGIFASTSAHIRELQMEPLNRYPLYNGPLACELRTYRIQPEAADTPPAVPRLHPAAPPPDVEAFVNRIRKNTKTLRKWLQDEGVTCYRIYDADIPEFNIAVDVYEKLFQVQEYAPPHTIDSAKADLRLKLAVRALQDLFDLYPRQVVVKVRHRQKRGSRYQRQSAQGRLYEVREGPCRLLVNMTDYLDTGLFLDHRIVRSMIRERVCGKRFLNLFGYTGTATVHAAVGGASATVTVDLSPVYLQWARSNLALNGFSEQNHRLVQADCMEWLSRTRDQFDVILAAPPTFSDSKRLTKAFAVQNDHSELVRLAVKRLAPGGVLFFSTPFRKFKLDSSLTEDFDVADITRKTIPRDFKRNPRIHACWEIRKRQQSHQ